MYLSFRLSSYPRRTCGYCYAWLLGLFSSTFLSRTPRSPGLLGVLRMTRSLVILMKIMMSIKVQMVMMRRLVFRDQGVHALLLPYLMDSRCYSPFVNLWIPLLVLGLLVVLLQLIKHLLLAVCQSLDVLVQLQGHHLLVFLHVLLSTLVLLLVQLQGQHLLVFLHVLLSILILLLAQLQGQHLLVFLGTLILLLLLQ